MKVDSRRKWDTQRLKLGNVFHFKSGNWWSYFLFRKKKIRGLFTQLVPKYYTLWCKVGKDLLVRFTRESSAEVRQNRAKQLFRLPCWHLADNGSYSQSYGFSSSHVWIWALDGKEGWVSKNCSVGEDSWKSVGQQEDQTSQS